MRRSKSANNPFTGKQLTGKPLGIIHKKPNHFYRFMRKINATIQGLITGTLMILISLFIFQVKKSFDNNLQYITYAVYIAGITWTLVYFHRFSSQEKKFKTISPRVSNALSW